MEDIPRNQSLMDTGQQLVKVSDFAGIERIVKDAPDRGGGKKARTDSLTEVAVG